MEARKLKNRPELFKAVFLILGGIFFLFLRFGTGSDFTGVRSENVGKRTPADAKDGQADDHAHSFFS